MFLKNQITALIELKGMKLTYTIYSSLNNIKYKTPLLLVRQFYGQYLYTCSDI